MNTAKNSLVKYEIKKHNTLTDGYIPHTGNAVLPDKLLNAFYWLYENRGHEFSVSISELRSLLGLKSIKDDERIYAAISLLQTPLQLRNFSYKDKSIDWISAPFLSRAIRWTDHKKMITIQLDEIIIEALKQKAGYAPLELNLCNRFQTKYGLKLYEMYIRYYNLSNKKSKNAGTISKSMDQLNAMLGTSYTHKSEIKKGIDRGLKEIEKITHQQIMYFFDNHEQRFVFSWHKESKYPRLRIPYNRIDELIEWYMSKNNFRGIASMPRYKQTLKTKVINDEFGDLDAYYRGMMIHKYKLSPDDYLTNGKYRNFKNPSIR